jgi:hypothetical protein
MSKKKRGYIVTIAEESKEIRKKKKEDFTVLACFYSIRFYCANVLRVSA